MSSLFPFVTSMSRVVSTLPKKGLHPRFSWKNAICEEKFSNFVGIYWHLSASCDAVDEARMKHDWKVSGSIPGQMARV